MEGSCEYTQESLLAKINELQFCCVDLNLYIDTHPFDDAAMEDYRCYSRKLNSLISKYEELYGPIMGFGHSMYPSSEWVTSAWPWE